MKIESPGHATWRLVVNPGAGRKRSVAALLPEFRALMEAKGAGFDAVESCRPGHVTELSREAAERGFEVVAVAGGDGTVREAAEGLSGTRTRLAILPAGSGNAVARELRIPLRPADAIAALRDARPVPMDAGRANGRTYLMAAGVGLDARVALRYAGLPAGRRGLLPYLKLAVSELLRRDLINVRLRVDGDPRPVEALIVAAANISLYGYGARIAPDARYDDGWLDLVVLGALPAALLPVYAARLFAGTLHRGSRVETARARSIRIESDTALDAHLDGDPFRFDSPLDIEVRPGAVNVLVPGAGP